MSGIILSFQIALIQISSVYLRYLPFRADLTDDEIKNFWRKMLLICGTVITADAIIFAIFGISPLIYKSIFILGMAAYFALSVFLIRKKFIYHIFILGMQALWSMLLHTLASITISMINGKLFINEIFLQSLLYMIFFALLFRLEVKLFENLLPAQRAIEKDFKWYIALLPLPIFFGILIPIFDDVLIHPLKEKIVRFFIPLFFFLVYRSFSNLTVQLEKKNQQEFFNQILNHQLQSLKERNLIIQDEQKKLAVFRHDLRHNYRLIAAMLNENKIQKAIDFISKQDELLRNVEANDDLPPSILQSVISIYRKKAQELLIKFNAKINLPLNYNSGDVTILLSNLLDNAINFNKSDYLENREIILSVSYDEENIFIEIANRFNEKIFIGENGLPRWKFGNGMKTLLAFRDKHFAKIKFVQTGERLNILIYFKY